MSDILIRGMDKPHNCFRCDLSYLSGERLFCCVTKDEVLRFKIAPDCPIHELPEHGDLIDKSELLENSKVNGMYPHWIDTMDVKRAHVVIPSNKEETE